MTKFKIGDRVRFTKERYIEVYGKEYLHLRDSGTPPRCSEFVIQQIAEIETPPGCDNRFGYVEGIYIYQDWELERADYQLRLPLFQVKGGTII